MLRKLRERIQSEEKGFTLIELLVVILIIGILAAIALPAFLSQRTKAQDADTKSKARNAVTAIESCYADTQNFTQCLTPPDMPAGATVNAAPDTGTDFYQVTATGNGRSFSIAKSNTGTYTRSCNTAGTGGCRGSGGGAGTW
jgi:type IV pilus assembly protein PilA